MPELASPKMSEFKPRASISSKRNIVKDKSVGDFVSITLHGKVKSVSMDDYDKSFRIELELSDGPSKEEFEKMSSEEQDSSMKEQVMNRTNDLHPK